MAVTKPDRLHYTGNDEADALLAHDPFALLVGFALDQQVPVPTAFQGPLKLKQRLGTLDPGQIAATDPGRLDQVFREKPAIHRFPGTMAKRVQDLASVVTRSTAATPSACGVRPPTAPTCASGSRGCPASAR